MAVQLSYVPTPNEQQYYEGLFQTADTQRKGSLSGGEAVAFFSRSKLTIDTLKNIWTASDRPTTNQLDRRKFAVAVRLIQLSQNGVKGDGPQLKGPPGLRPAMFEGISGVTVPLPPPQAASPPQQPVPAPQPAPPPRAPIPAQPSIQNLATPLSPQRQSISGPPPVMSMAITTQDPYSLPPQEQSRYEALFPRYERGDGFVYGKEAVELFGKSGVPQKQLRDIWNMVDSPVDNRLDKLEFAMAMHLIVCVSKKGLPMPTSLPISLKQLKQSDQSPIPRNSISEHSQGPPPIVPSLTPPDQPSHQNPQLSQPPPVQQPPQLSIQPPQQAPRLSLQPPSEQHPPQLSIQPPPAQQPPQVSLQPPPAPVQPPAPSLGAAPGQIAAPVVSGLPSVGMDISDAFEGLSATDNYDISAPISSGFGGSGGPPPLPPQPAVVETVPEPVVTQQPTYSAPAPPPAPEPIPEPAPVPKTTEQLAANYQQGDDMTELTKLKAILQRLQAENISLKAQLGSMTEEERAVQKETSAVVAEIGRLSNDLTELRAQVLGAKSKLLETTAGLSAAQEKKEVLSDLISQTTATKEALVSAAAGIEGANEALSAPPPPQAAPAPAPAPVAEADLFGWGDPPAAAPVALAPPAQVPLPQQPINQPFETQPAPVRMHSGVDTVDSSQTGDIDDETTEGGTEFLSFGGQPVPQGPAPAPQPQPAQPQPSHSLPPPGGSFNFGAGIMGGRAPSLKPAFEQQQQPAFEAPPAPAAASVPTRVDVEQLKAAAMRAEETAREAHDTHRTLAIEAQKLQALCQEAEEDARSKIEKASKKRGYGKKKNVKDAEMAQQAAAEKKKHYLEMQAQATNAQTLALESKREADSLRQKAEQAELDLAAAESVRESGAMPPPANGSGHVVAAPAPSTNGLHGIDPSKPAFGAVPPLNTGFGGPPADGGYGFGAGIMSSAGGGGGGGGGIPTPPQSTVGDDPYANPFG